MTRFFARARSLRNALTRLRLRLRQPSPQRILIIRPVLWSTAAVGTICFTCAAYEVRRDRNTLLASPTFPEAHRSSITERDLETVRQAAVAKATCPNPASAWVLMQEPYGECSTVFASIVGINLCTLMPSVANPSWRRVLDNQFSHWPATPHFRHHQLLTSAFLHAGPAHLGWNMGVFFLLGPKAANTTALQSSGSPFLAFCLSAAVLTNLANHVVSAAWPRRNSHVTFTRGFSGVAYAVLAVSFVMDQRTKISLFSTSVPFHGDSILQYLKMYELLGVAGILQRLLPGTHAVSYATHLAGLMLGEAYAKRSGQGELWLWFRSQAFQTMKTLGAI